MNTFWTGHICSASMRHILHAWLRACALPSHSVDPKGPPTLHGNNICDRYSLSTFTHLSMVQMSKRNGKNKALAYTKHVNQAKKKIIACLVTVSSHFACHNRSHRLIQTEFLILFTLNKYPLTFRKIISYSSCSK